MPSDTRTFRTSCALVFLAISSLALAEPVPETPVPSPHIAAPAGQIERFRAEVVNVYPHDPTAFTQGLLLSGGMLFESTGLQGRSTVREVELTTGKVKRQLELAPTYFGEGLALAGDRLVQLTWQNHVAFVYDPATFKQLGQLAYSTEGWGLCFDGQRLILSDGSDQLYFHDPRTFARLGVVTVTLNGQ